MKLRHAKSSTARRAVAHDCDIQDGWGGTNVINANPLFINPTGLKTGSYQLNEGSPCQDVGEGAALPLDVGDLDWDGNTTETIPLDLARQPRVMIGPVDLGAYEIQPGIE